ncbi:MAG TPA: alcohol dehydrogenase catalytic domain-containing protein [Propionicimonas sp.]|jgi:threonine dehydrogenase-like Zn-dependent dehydrogenase|uniref:alcohol dehydrogenase catalytic domain-containing protein n=1 Tax=Propionicimonas sp. TaxID=1955623 RepID=UPI002F3FF18F
MTQEFPATQHAIQFVGADQVVHNPAKAMYPLGPRQLLLKSEACGICFSDTKLLHAFTNHPRKSEVLSGLSAEELAEIPSYKPGAEPGVPGHEPVGRIVAVGSDVRHHTVGERVLVQTDYRHLPTASSNAAFGYNFEGALQEYVVLDERVIMDPATGERFLIPVSDGPSASAVALIEPWACVEAAYAWGERTAPKAGGRMLVVADAVDGLDDLLAQAAPASITVVGAVSLAGATRIASVDELDGTFDDIVYVGSDADVVEALGSRIGFGGILDVVLAGGAFDRRVKIDVGRVHYDLIRYTGTDGSNAAAGYARIPAQCELREGDRIAIVGAAGPMGLMHTVRTAVSGVPGISMDAVDVDDARLAHLAAVVAPVAEANGVPATFRNSKTEPLDGGYTYVAAMVPAPFLIAQAVDISTDGAIVNAFAGFAIGTMAELDLTAIATKGIYLVGTSGSRIQDMETMLAKVEDGTLDTNVSLWAVTGMAGVADGIEAVNNRTSGGKIMVYPTLPDLGLVRLDELAEKLPAVAAAMVGGRWTKAAEAALLASQA